MQSRDQQSLEQQDIERLIILLENWLELSWQMQALQENLSYLPEDLSLLRKYYVKDQGHRQIPSEVKRILENLEQQMPKVLNLKSKISNSLALREIMEALGDKLSHNRNNQYEISFKKAELSYLHSQLQKNNYHLRVPISFKQKITNFWEHNYSKVTIGVGIFALISYGTLLLVINPQIDSTDIKDQNFSKEKLQ
ncbi:MAG: hypothetical protein AAFQ80_02960 [Cyanobacteria bacterium J06621_8]